MCTAATISFKLPNSRRHNLKEQVVSIRWRLGPLLPQQMNTQIALDQQLTDQNRGKSLSTISINTKKAINRTDLLDTLETDMVSPAMLIQLSERTTRPF